MKCGAKLVYFKKLDKKGNLRIFRAYPPESTEKEIWESLPKERTRIKLMGRLGRCCGNVKCTVYAEDEPYYGGNSAILDVTCKCDFCGMVYGKDSKDVPDEYNINDWINKILDEKE